MPAFHAGPPSLALSTIMPAQHATHRKHGALARELLRLPCTTAHPAPPRQRRRASNSKRERGGGGRLRLSPLTPSDSTAWSGAKEMPSTGRTTRPYVRIWFTLDCTTLLGMANLRHGGRGAHSVRAAAARQSASYKAQRRQPAGAEDCSPDARVGSRGRHDGRVDADDAARAVEQRAAAVACTRARAHMWSRPTTLLLRRK